MLVNTKAFLNEILGAYMMLRYRHAGDVCERAFPEAIAMTASEALDFDPTARGQFHKGPLSGGWIQQEKV